MAMLIGEAARRSGCSLPTLRYYEDVGLLRPVGRGANGRRIYGWPDVSRLTFIRRSRDVGLSIPEIRTLLAVSDGGSDCGDARQVIVGHLDAIRKRQHELRSLESSLQAIADRCGSECAGGLSDSCTIFEDLAPASAQ